MHIIIGGAYQGKTEYALKCLKEKMGYNPSPEETEKNVVLNLHLIIYEATKGSFDGKIVEEIVAEITKKEKSNKDLIITCDEVGLGIIPMERKEREYREAVGKVLQRLVKGAERVDRMVAGVPVRIK